MTWLGLLILAASAVLIWAGLKNPAGGITGALHALLGPAK